MFCFVFVFFFLSFLFVYVSFLKFGFWFLLLVFTLYWLFSSLSSFVCSLIFCYHGVFILFLCFYLEWFVFIICLGFGLSVCFLFCGVCCCWYLFLFLLFVLGYIYLCFLFPFFLWPHCIACGLFIPGQGWGLGLLWEHRVQDVRPPENSQAQRIVISILLFRVSITTLKPGSTNCLQAPVQDTSSQTTSKTGTQLHLSDKLPKVIVSLQDTPKHTTWHGPAIREDSAPPTRGASISLSLQKVLKLLDQPYSPWEEKRKRNYKPAVWKGDHTSSKLDKMRQQWNMLLV